MIEMDEGRLIKAAKSAVNGLLNDEVVAVAVGWDDVNSHLTLRYYFSRGPGEEDKDLCSSALAELEAEYWREIKVSEAQSVYVSNASAELDQLTSFVYLRCSEI